MKISLPQLGKTLEHDGKKRIFDVLLDNQIPIASSCRGNGICHWCKVQISGSEVKLSALSKREKEANLRQGERLSCQCKARGDVEVRTSYW